MFRHLKCHPQGAHWALLKLHTDFLVLLRPENLYVILARHSELPEDDILNDETRRSLLFVNIAFDVIVQLMVQL